MRGDYSEAEELLCQKLLKIFLNKIMENNVSDTYMWTHIPSFSSP